MLVLAILTIPALCQYYETGQPLVQPEVRSSVNGTLNTTFVVSSLRYEGYSSFNTRVYEQSFPGPTLELEPGDTMNLVLRNQLGSEKPLVDQRMNRFHSPNVTNLHLHGLHISPSGSSDNMEIVVNPGNTFFHQYQIPADHAPGLYFYHPHHHGSVALQVMGGMGGAIIVKDPNTPPEIRAMSERVIVFQQFSFDEDDDAFNPFLTFSAVSEAIGSRLPIDLKCNLEEKRTNLYLVNGQYLPRLTMRPGEFQLFRFVEAGHHHMMEMNIPGCEMHHLAADGINFDLAAVREKILFTSGTRADVAIRCPNEGTFYLNSDRDHDQDFYLGGDADFSRYKGDLMIIDVEGPPMEMPPPRSLSPRPSYLPDLMGSPIDPKNVHEIWINATLRHEFICEDDGFCYTNVTLNGKNWAGSNNFEFTMRRGEIHEFHFINIHVIPHPLHFHVNHMQIVSIHSVNGPLSSFMDWEIGQWRDTILVPPGGTIVARTRPHLFPGKCLFHCHTAFHSDLGMLGVVNIL
eukprot:Lithocolla_globosa_v1_NODE_1624_length_2441_cov_23.537301.p1 type:complete len:516 gc:universal NODE_1624_length_2441_cov_23.537301:199-1746(+)